MTALRDPAPIWDIDPFAEEVLEQPAPYFAELRERGPFVWLSKYDLWATGRYEEVRGVFRDWQRFCSSRGVGVADFAKAKPWRPPSLVLEADPPAHTRTRAVLTSAMVNRRVARLRDRFEREAERLVERALFLRRFDGMRELARPFPLKVFPDAVGLDDEGRENLLRYANMVFNALGPDNPVRRRAMSDAEGVTEWIAEKCQRGALASGGFGAHIYAAADRGEIDESEASLLVRSLLSAGVDTTVSALGMALLCFARHPDQWERLRTEPALARAAFDEVLRLESPVHSFFRTTTTDVKLSGVQLGQGRKVLLCIAAANRDPRHWEDPERFDITRRAGGHLAFGVGIHACVGMRVARLEAEVLLGAMARRIGRMELAAEPTWLPGNALRMLASLPLAVRAA